MSNALIIILLYPALCGKAKNTGVRGRQAFKGRGKGGMSPFLFSSNQEVFYLTRQPRVKAKRCVIITDIQQ